MTVDFFILGLMCLELSWCALRLRSWTSLAGYRRNRAQGTLLLSLQVPSQTYLDCLCLPYYLRQRPERLNVERAMNHSNALSVLKDTAGDIYDTSAELCGQGLNPLGTSPKHMHTPFFNVCIRSDFNSHKALNYLRTTFFASYVGFDTKLFLKYPTQVVDRFGFHFPFRLGRGWCEDSVLLYSLYIHYVFTYSPRSHKIPINLFGKLIFRLTKFQI